MACRIIRRGTRTVSVFLTLPIADLRGMVLLLSKFSAHYESKFIVQRISANHASAAFFWYFADVAGCGIDWRTVVKPVTHVDQYVAGKFLGFFHAASLSSSIGRGCSRWSRLPLLR